MDLCYKRVCNAHLISYYITVTISGVAAPGWRIVVAPIYIIIYIIPETRRGIRREMTHRVVTEKA